MSSPHRWTPEQDAVLSRIAAGEISVTEARAIIGVGYDAVHYRMTRLGLRVPQKKARKELPPVAITAADGWVPIAHKSDRYWTPLEGAPMPPSVARAMAEAGRAFLAHRRVDGGFDLLVRMRA